MKNRQEQDYSVYQYINQVCQRYAPSVPWKQHQGFSETFDLFLARMANVRRLRLLQVQESTGITLDKQALRRHLAEITIFVADATVAFANRQNELDLATKAHVTPSSILHGKQDDAVSISQNVHDYAVAAPLALGLKPFGVTTEKLTELQEAIDDFADAIPQPRLKIKSRKSVTEQLAEEFRAATALLTEGLDRLIGQFRKAHPEFVSEYENARVRVAKAATFGTAEPEKKPVSKAA